MDTVEIRVHPSNFQRVIRDAHERGAKVSRRADGRYLIDELPVILDARLMSATNTRFPIAAVRSSGTDGDFTSRGVDDAYADGAKS